MASLIPKVDEEDEVKTLIPEDEETAAPAPALRPRRERKRVSDANLQRIHEFVNAPARSKATTEPEKAPKPLGVTGTIKEGAKSTARALGATVDTYQGDEAEVVAASKAQQAVEKDPRLASFLAAIADHKQRLGPDPSLWESIKAVGSAALDNPAGAGLMVAEQIPNSAVALGAGGAGALAGSVAGPVGAIAGGLIGLGTANVALETGHKALEAAADEEFGAEDQERVTKEGAIKGGVVSGVDALTLGATKFITGASRRAVERATTKTLADQGVDVGNAAAVKSALADPAVMASVNEARKLAAEASSKLGKRIAQTGGALALETIGEGAGEYIGEFAATGEANAVDAVVESLAGLSQSMGEVAFTTALNKRAMERLFDSEKDAEATAKTVTESTGVEHEVQPHPVEPEKFIAVPKTKTAQGVELEQDELGNIKPKAPEEAEGLNEIRIQRAEGRAGFERSAEDKLILDEKRRKNAETYARNPLVIPGVDNVPAPADTPKINGKPVTDLSNNTLVYSVNHGSSRAKKVAQEELSRRKTEGIDPKIADAVSTPSETVDHILKTGSEKTQETIKAPDVPTPTLKAVKPAPVPETPKAPKPETNKTQTPKIAISDSSKRLAETTKKILEDQRVSKTGASNPTSAEKPIVSKEETAEEKIRSATKKIEGGFTLGKWHPITVTHNNATQHFLATQKRAGGDGPGALTLVHIKHGHLAKGLKETHVATTYKLTKNNELQQIGFPSEANQETLAEWTKAKLPINPKNPIRNPDSIQKEQQTKNEEPPKTEPDATVRPLIEALIKRRAVAHGELHRGSTFDKALATAKSMLAGEDVSPARFKTAAAILKNDKITADILTELHTRATEAKKAKSQPKQPPKEKDDAPRKETQGTAEAAKPIPNEVKTEKKAAFSRSSAEGKSSLPKSNVQSVADSIRKGWKNAPEVVVLNSMDDATPAAQAENTKQFSQGASGEPEGFISEGKVYLIADQLRTPEDVVRVLLHESLGHFGLRGTFGQGIETVLKQVSALRRRDVEAKAKQYGLDVTKQEDRLIAAEEVLAELSQTNPQNAFVQRAIAAIRTWLRNNIPGFKNLALSDAEIIEGILIPARQFVQQGGPSTQIDSKILFSRATTASTATPFPFRERIDKAVDSLIYNFQDRFKPLKDIQERAGPVAEDADASLAEERYSGTVRARTDMFEEELRDPLLKAIHDSGVAYEDVEEYLHALHAPSRNAAMREINPTVDELKEQISALDAQRDSLSKDADVAEYLKLRRELRQAEADIEDGIADESLGRMLKSEIAQLKKTEAVKDYTDAVDKLKGLRLVKPFNGDNTALSGMSNAESEAILAKIDGNGTRKALEKISSIVDTITSRTRQIYVESGLEKANVIEAWDKKYDHYIPLHRDEVNEGTMPKTGQGFNIRGKESKRATGSNKEVTNILAHVVAQHEAAIIRSEKSKVDRALFRFAQLHPDPTLWTLDDTPMIPTVDQTTGFVVQRVDPTFKNRPEVLTMKIDGDEHTITFNDHNPEAMRLAASMKNMSSQELGEVTQMVGWVTRKLATLNTTANPVFIARNFLRDLQTAYVNLSDTTIADKKAEVFRNVPAAIKGMWDLSRGKHNSQWAKYAKEFKNAGGQTGWMEHYNNIGERANSLRKDLEIMGPGKWNFTRRKAQAWWDIIQGANNAVENAARLASYVSARKAGLSEGKAAQIAKNLTVNFNTHGAKGVELNAWYMFMNASIQGTARLAKALSNKQVQKIVAGVIVSGFLMDIMARSMAGDDDENGENDYDQLPEHTKAMNFVLMVDGSPVTIPMPYGYNFFASTGRKISEMIFRENYSAVKSAGDLAAVFLDAFSPTGQAGSALQYVAPTVADPFVQWAENKNFAGNPLRRQQNPFGVPNPEYQMGFKSTSAPAKWLAEVLNDETGGNEVRPGYVNVNPVFFDFAVSSIAGGAGRTYLQAVSGPIKAGQGDELQAREIPFLNIFLSAKPEYQTERKYFEAAGKVETAKKELKTYRDKGDMEMVRQIREEHGAELKLIRAAENSKKILTRLRKRELNLDKTDRPDKAEMRRQIEERRREIMSRFNKRYMDAIAA